MLIYDHMKHLKRFITLLFLLFFVLSSAVAESLGNAEEIFELDLEQLMDVAVISASNVREKLLDVPATMIVIAAEEIQLRGYSSLAEILDDLPGMDITNAYSNKGLLNYWRGFRASYSQPYLFMIDGMEQNEMYYNCNQAIGTIPLSNIQRVEVVYGPVSSVYGANAFMGVINVITVDKQEEGIDKFSKTGISQNGEFYGDYAVHAKNRKYSTSLAVRFESSDIADQIDLDNTFYTSTKLLTDTLLWGDLPNSIYENGEIQSQRRLLGIGYKISIDGFKLGLDLSSYYSDWGLFFPTDRTLLGTPFYNNSFSTWVSQEYSLSKEITSQSILRFRYENRSDGDFFEGYNITNESSDPAEIAGVMVNPGESIRVVDLSTWPLTTNAWSYKQNFDIQPMDRLKISTGGEFKHREFSKQTGYYGEQFIPEDVDIDNPEFYPAGDEHYKRSTNLFTWSDYGVYSQLKYSLNSTNFINTGIRIDNNSEYGNNTTFRGGYINHFNKFTFKLLYGQAYQVPTPRTLYSGWTPFGGSADLDPETSETFEFNVCYNNQNIYSWISTYFVQNDNTIISLEGDAKNLGTRNIIGLDYHASTLFPVGQRSKVKFSFFYSTYLTADEDVYDIYGIKTGEREIGDLSKHKIYFGTSAFINSHLSVNLRGRYKSERKTVYSNPIDKIDSFFTLDANIMYKGIFLENLTIALKVNNILDEEYYHPGFGLANAGDSDGYWNGLEWVGSQGWHTSIIPQPHRNFLISLILN